ncbi:branched chain amino acid aminotransferase [Desulfosarcina ovata subsp. sediminis]|uniref:branched-chain-amino-acid transaminase n=1 Tax=Desulfosarcina ovata subsp. sediminis TaxID=885957 RepID=A0A5K7ZLN6_9BACT|nr:aminotransferase class IV [Desulfosarcina ovata]BBO82006.1 branched chain amino acid aminotransferase [Desulfosarcina ovata subsp. sediminis]
MPVYYVDGKFVPAEKAVIPVDDLAILRGIGVFDLLRTYDGKPYFLDAHIDRLENSARKIKLPLPWSHNDIAEVVKQTLAKNDIPEANIRIVVTGGSSTDFMTPSGTPRLLVLVSPVPKLPDSWYTDGVKIVSWEVERPIPGAKSIDYISASLALKKAAAAGGIEALYIDRKGLALECTTSNIFAFVGERLVTPGRGILSGVTRKVVLDLAEGLFPIDIRDISRSELLAADEVFITGTSKGLVPVVQVDNGTIGNGRPGVHTRRLMAEMKQHTEKQ